MGKIWLPAAVRALAVMALAAPLLWVAPALAEEVPQIQPDDHIMGKADAPGTIFEYASLTCPHCARFDEEVLPQIKTLWIDTGKAKLVFRDYPLDQAALKASQVAWCAPPDRYFAFLDMLFKTQASWATAGNLKEALIRLAKFGGMGEEKVNACLADETLSNKIVGERLKGEQDYGIDSTPTFFVNGKKLVGEQPIEDIAEALGEKVPEGTAKAPATPGAASSAAKP